MVLPRFGKYVYRPKLGDEVKWPNGLVMIAAPDGVTVLPEGDGDQTLTVREGVGETVSIAGYVWTIGVKG